MHLILGRLPPTPVKLSLSPTCAALFCPQVTTADGYILTLNRIRDLSVAPPAQPPPAGAGLCSGGQTQAPAQAQAQAQAQTQPLPASVSPGSGSAAVGLGQPQSGVGPGQLLRGRITQEAQTATTGSSEGTHLQRQQQQQQIPTGAGSGFESTAAGMDPGSVRAPGLAAPLPVVLDHALFLGGHLWFGFSGGPPDPLIDQRLPVLLAREGHDVWVVHHRATEFSPGHVSLTPEDFVSWMPEGAFAAS